jgi:hypothetical protein
VVFLSVCRAWTRIPWLTHELAWHNGLGRCFLPWGNSEFKTTQLPCWWSCSSDQEPEIHWVLVVLDKGLQNDHVSSTKKLRRRKKDHATVQVQLWGQLIFGTSTPRPRHFPNLLHASVSALVHEDFRNHNLQWSPVLFPHSQSACFFPQSSSQAVVTLLFSLTLYTVSHICGCCL